MSSSSLPVADATLSLSSAPGPAPGPAATFGLDDARSDRSRELAVDAPCPCGSGRAHGVCCGPILSGLVRAPTAEALMRARYVAFTQGNVAFLRATLTPAQQEDFNPAEVTETADAQWQGLEIRKVTGGGADETEGWVEFVARFRLRGRAIAHHERTRFVRAPAADDSGPAGWLCDEGVLNPKDPPRAVAKVGRNDPCPCGSGKKYKKCCGA